MGAIATGLETGDKNAIAEGLAMLGAIHEALPTWVQKEAPPLASIFAKPR